MKRRDAEAYSARSRLGERLRGDRSRSCASAKLVDLRQGFADRGQGCVQLRPAPAELLETDDGDGAAGVDHVVGRVQDSAGS